MEAAKQRYVKSGAQYSHLFPEANVHTQTVRRNAAVSDTVAFIPKVVAKTLGHTKAVARMLKGRNDYETCRNIWQFVYGHIAYRKDRDGYEQIRSPARTWHDRKSGVDCDCYTTFISSVLTNLGIKHKLRITKYGRDYFQHIYPVALLHGRAVVLDCVTDHFDYEVPFSEKKDYPMDLQYLDGIDGYSDYPGAYDGIGALGKAKSGKKKKGLKIDLKKALNIVNKVNPATVALRNGVLASMKLNIGNVAKRLRWSYMTQDQARAKGVDMDRWNNLVKARQKLEQIFYDAGGKPANFKKAILQGKGNKDHAVHGLDGFGSLRYGYANARPVPVTDLHPGMPLRKLLGDDIFYSENEMGMLGALGEPASMAMVAAASSVIAAIASTLKKIGDIFKGKGAGSKDFDEKANADAAKEIPAAKDGDKSGDTGSDTATGSDSSGGGGTDDDGDGDKDGDGKGGDDKGGDGGDGGDKKEGFWSKNKKWLVPAGIGAAGLGIIAVAAHASKPKNGKQPSKSKPMHGTPHTGKKNHHRAKPKKLASVAL